MWVLFSCALRIRRCGCRFVWQWQCFYVTLLSKWHMILMLPFLCFCTVLQVLYYIRTKRRSIFFRIQKSIALKYVECTLILHCNALHCIRRRIDKDNNSTRLATNWFTHSFTASASAWPGPAPWHELSSRPVVSQSANARDRDAMRCDTVYYILVHVHVGVHYGVSNMLYRTA